jgi:hypothetical protein
VPPRRWFHTSNGPRLSAHLGHADPGFTLRIYTHLMPTSQDRARQAMDAVLGNLADYSRTRAAEEG